MIDLETEDAKHQPIPVQLVGDQGLVWSIPDVLKLRRQHHLVGSMVGGVAGYKSQVSVGGLPLQLAPEEVCLALKQGWIRLERVGLSAQMAAAALRGEAAAEQQQQQQQQPVQLVQTAEATATQAAGAHSAAGPGGQSGGQQQQQQSWHQQHPNCQQAFSGHADEEELDEFYAAYYGLDQQQQQQLSQQQQQHDMNLLQQQQQQQQQQRQQWQAPWSAAVSSGAAYELPLTVEQLLNSCTGSDSSSGTAGAPLCSHWQLQPVEGQADPLSPAQAAALQGAAPVTAWGAGIDPAGLQALKNAVFEDLHSRGFFITVGGKFGGHFLAYPGDPALYHSQYVVRLAAPGQALSPVVLRAVARGVHTARKHLVLATWAQAAAAGAAQSQDQDGCSPVVRYITITKSDGFGGIRPT